MYVGTAGANDRLAASSRSHEKSHKNPDGVLWVVLRCTYREVSWVGACPRNLRREGQESCSFWYLPTSPILCSKRLQIQGSDDVVGKGSLDAASFILVCMQSAHKDAALDKE